MFILLLLFQPSFPKIEKKKTKKLKIKRKRKNITKKKKTVSENNSNFVKLAQ